MTKSPCLAYLLFILLFSGCLSNQADETTVYFSDFEKDDFAIERSIDRSFVTYHNSSERFFNFNGSRNLGRFERGGITLNLEGLTEHQFVRVKFDLYIHDKWEGSGLRGNNEDVFILNIDDSNIYFSSIVNTKCLTKGCQSRQSFPSKIDGTSNPENANVFNPRLPGVCHYINEAGGSKLIRIVELHPHSSKNLRINIGADIKESGSDLCLKSWSLDNLDISIITLPGER